MGDCDQIARLPAILWRAVTDVVGWRSLPVNFWEGFTRHVGEGTGRFLIGVGLVTTVIFVFVALAILL